MRDEDYNRLFGTQPTPLVWVFLAVAILSVVFCISFAAAEEGNEDIEPHHIVPHVDEDCAASFSCNSQKTWELIYKGEVVNRHFGGDLTFAECEELRAELEAQTEAFTEIYCRPRLVEREDS